jgi:hypothetical protein
VKAIAKSDIAAIEARINAALIFPGEKTKNFVSAGFVGRALVGGASAPTLLFQIAAT